MLTSVVSLQQGDFKFSKSSEKKVDIETGNLDIF